MKRRLLNSLTILSLLLCLACTFLWVRSGFFIDSLQKQDRDNRTSFLHTAGNLQVELERNRMHARAHMLGEITPSVPWQWDSVSLQEALTTQPLCSWTWAWPHYRSQTFGWSNGTQVDTYILLPYWLPTGLAACLPALRLWHWRRAKKAAGVRPRGFEVQPAPSPPAR